VSVVVLRTGLPGSRKQGIPGARPDISSALASQNWANDPTIMAETGEE